MEEEKKLYPFKFIPIDENPQENVLLADLGYQDSLVREGWLAANSISEIMDMYMDRVVGEHVFAWYGRQFPVMARVLDGSERTPLMVCPDDETAAQRLDFLGKAKLWHVDSVHKGAKIYLGFKEDTSAEAFYYACRDNKAESLLYSFEPKEGDSFFIYPGLVHAAGKGVKITEIAECSPLDFRLNNWGKAMGGDDFDAALTLEAAFDFIDYKKYNPGLHNHAHSHDGGISSHLTECEEFSVTKLSLSDAMHIYSSKLDCFLLYVCLNGEASLQVIFDQEIGPINYTVKAGECILVPAEVPDFFLVPVAKGTSLLEVTVEKREDADAYINPDVPGTLPGEEDSDWDDEEEEEDECEDPECECHHHHHHHHHLS
ncbi:MAG: class I mannose-6-phosphate isomerase [Bacteroidales bacterium]|nr:class I mannose-6-phosphate isomerase [Bacteroidales bacterium]